MKFLLKTILTVITAVTILHGCNSEVFISDFAPSVNEVRLSEKIQFLRLALTHPIGMYSQYFCG